MVLVDLRRSKRQSKTYLQNGDHRDEKGNLVTGSGGQQKYMGEYLATGHYELLN